jgi:hypothetical protein
LVDWEVPPKVIEEIFISSLLDKAVRFLFVFFHIIQEFSQPIHVIAENVDHSFAQ